MPGKFTKYQIATAIALLFHSVGLVGVLFFRKFIFLQCTAGNLLLMLILLLWTQTGRNRHFFYFLLSCFIVGMGIEIIGVRTGAFFGHYHYGAVMGYQIMDVPLILGVNWFIVIYCSGVTLDLLTAKAISRDSPAKTTRAGLIVSLSVIFGGAVIAVFYDWFMEPVAVKLDYWRWNAGGSIPVYNYVSWFIVSVLLLSLFQVGKFDKRNKFAVNLLLIQLVFFLLLRFFLN